MARLDGKAVLVTGAASGIGRATAAALAASVEETTLEDRRGVMAVNLDGTFLGRKHVIGAMKATGGGSIVNLSSFSGIVGGHDLAAYDASKGGVRLLTKSVALHCAREGYAIRRDSVHPAFVETPMVERLVAESADTDRARASMARQVPLGRIAAPEEIAGMIVYLISDEAAFVTGAEMVIDGGVTAR